MDLMMVIIAILVIIACFVALEKFTDYFVDAMSSIAKKHGIPQTVIGATFAAIGSSMPEFSTSSFAVATGHEELGIGTIVGSAIFNILAIIGIAAYVRKCELSREVFYRDGLVYLITVGILTAFIFDGKLEQHESIIMVVVYCIYFTWLMRDAQKHRNDYEAQEKDLPADVQIEILDSRTTTAYLLLGMSVIVITAYAIVRSAIVITDEMGINEGVFSLIVIAAGSSIPDLFTSREAAKKGMGGLAVSNAIGSNTFDILVCIGLPMAFLPSVDIELTGSTGLSVFFLFASVALTLFLIRTKWVLDKREGVIMLGLYAAYVIALIVGEVLDKM